ncbi:MAG: 2-C-methyl-D-erythritol 4-phosphate cytidylyltransferase [Clostridiales bacterium]|jgi:2-C-methyl-D-erythritol 4-phosphate cytidylyltransferase|nr:2-C-methyl-D-erythritol 4-phosphate cytidylyltransferase [Clostridiales bacterium]
MVTAMIFAGGTGQRMNSKTKPKQFLELHGKSILIYTIENFEYHEEIDNIVVVCIDDWINTLWEQIRRFNITKVSSVIPGANTGQGSIYNGIKVVHNQSKSEEDIVLIHDGVRPFVSEKLISDNIRSVRKYGSGITVVPAKESIIRTDEDNNTISEVYKRNTLSIARAPQSFFVKDIWEVHNRALADGKERIIDSVELMQSYGYELHTVECLEENIKITTAYDYYIFKAIYEAKEGSQIYGI